ncbi:lysylphosphatidylglycerol synthase transmembrane domain-containing protein [Pedobacter cryophilus]|nr:lysylphosphatidylglycerol synthase transmembrane domain-containing protein [Pedobacter cryophilus]
MMNKNWLKFTLKIIISAICLYYVFTKIDFIPFFNLLKTVRIFWLALATIFFILSKIIGAFRLNIYLKNAEINLTEKENLKLYWLGMFYNLFLPGGIGGDAYKIILLKKHFNKSYKTISTAVLLDRISGLVALIGLAIISACFIPLSKWYLILVIISFFSGYTVYRFILFRYFATHRQNILKTDLLGLMVQLSQGFSIICIAFALSTAQNFAVLLVIFYISSLSTLLPLSVGGLGAREIIFLFSAKYLGIPQEVSVSISLVFYMISALVSLVGVYFVFGRMFSDKVDD